MSAGSTSITFEVKHRRKKHTLTLPSDANMRALAAAIEDATCVPAAAQTLRGLGPGTESVAPSTRIASLPAVRRSGRGAVVKIMVLGKAVAAADAGRNADTAADAARLAAATAAAEAALDQMRAEAVEHEAAVAAAARAAAEEADAARAAAATAAASALHVKPGVVSFEVTGGVLEWDGLVPSALSSNQAALPPELLGAADRAGLAFPYFFELSVAGPASTFRSVVAVREFTAPPGTIVVPPALLDKVGGLAATTAPDTRVWLRSKTLPKGSFASLQPLTDTWASAVAFDDQTLVLQSKLQSLYQHIGPGDTVEFEHAGVAHAFLVVAVEPDAAPAISLIDTELAVDIRPPLSPMAGTQASAAFALPPPPSVVRLDDAAVGASTATLEANGLPAAFIIFFPPAVDALSIRADGTTDIDVFVTDDPDVPRPTNAAYRWRDVSCGSSAHVVVAAADVAPGAPLYVTVEAWDGAAGDVNVAVAPAAAAAPGTSEAGEIDDDASVCERCGARVPAASALTHDLRCARIARVTCDACGKVLEERAVAKHMARVHDPVVCVCGAVGEPAVMLFHRSDECPMRKVACVYCGLRIPMSARGDHQGACGAKTAACAICGHRTARKWLDSHINTEHAS